MDWIQSMIDKMSDGQLNLAFAVCCGTLVLLFGLLLI